MLSVLLFTSLVTLFAAGIAFLWRWTERNALQRTLTRILGILLFLFVVIVFNMLRRLAGDEPAVVGVLNFDSIALGVVAFFASVRYYIIAAHRNIFSTRSSLMFISPTLPVLAFYAIWHWTTDSSPFFAYTTMEALYHDLWTIPVMLHILSLLFFAIYMIAIHLDIWLITSVHQNQPMMNAADAASNIKYLRKIVFGMAAIILCYFIVMFDSPLRLILYTGAEVVVFLVLVDIVLSRRFYSTEADCRQTWNIWSGWEIVRNTSPASQTTDAPLDTETTQAVDTPQTAEEKEVDKPLDASLSNAELLHHFDEWMEDKKPYCDSSFTSQSVVTMFQSIGYVRLNELLNKRGENIQACIRRYRIQEACRQIEANPQINLLLLSRQVGFMQQSSFSRAFQVVTAITPTRYAQAIVANKR